MPTPSLHASFIQSRLPGWIKHLAAPDIEALNRARDPVQRFQARYPEAFAAASPLLRQALIDSGVRRQASSQALATVLKDLKGITEFAEPLLVEALRKRFGVAPDVNGTALFHMRAPNRLEQQSLLQAALRNFEADEPFDEVALQETSALAPAGSLEQILYDESQRYPFAKVRYHVRDKLAIKPAEFADLCRQLDLGRQYQQHLSTVFGAPASTAQVRRQTIEANKDAWRVHAHIARMRSVISASAYAALLAIIDGMPTPRLDGAQVTYSQLNLLGSDVSDLVIIGSVSRKPLPGLDTLIDLFLPQAKLIKPLIGDSRIIVCIPGDPLDPIREYASLKAFATQLAIKLRSPGYQRFFAGRLPLDEAQTFLRRLKSQLKTNRWNPNPVPPGPNYNPAAFASGMYEEVWSDDVDLHAKEAFIETDVFAHLYDKHLERVTSNAKLLAVPTAQVDHDAWRNRLKHWAEWGLNVLNVAAFFVPGLGEVMMAITAVQIGYEVYQGAEAWSVGDSAQAWAHLTSVMQNVASMAALGAVAGRARTLVPSPFVNGMRRVVTPFGKLRLWHPDLSTYKSSVSLKGLTPNALGQYTVAGKTYISLEGSAFEKRFDPALKEWRIKHPVNQDAYQPIVRHNGRGAWRHTLERPLEWSRLKLLRRTGPHMEHLSDAQVEQIADVSGFNDDGLRAMHVDHQVPPPEFLEMARLFEVDRQTDEVIGNIRAGACLGKHCQFMAPLAVEMPEWPAGEVVEVFSGPEPWGASQRFGTGSTRPLITITQAEVNAGKLPEKILAGLDQAQITRVLGSEGARPGVQPVQILRERLADQAQARKKALFESLLSAQAVTDADTQVLQRSFASLSPEAAQQVLGDASAAELNQLRSTGRVPLRLAKDIRVHLHQSFLSRALAGLYLESLASTASDRLALHCLEQLPGWSTDIRVELRARGIRGPLVDSIGSEQAATRFYLIKGNDQFRTFEAGGRALNSVPKHGRNLFESLLHVVPETVRGALQGEQGAALRKQVADYACRHRDEMSRILKRDPLKGAGARRVRRPSGLLGYAASGDTVGFADEPLVARVRDVYPNLDDRQAAQFIRSRQLAGDTDQQVFHLLENRSREFEGLRTVLQTWVDEGTVRFPQGPNWPTRRVFADRIIGCWRNGLVRGLAPAFDLDLLGADSLPPWDADFSHVRRVRAGSAQLVDGTLVQRFSALESLDIALEAADMPALASRLPAWHGIVDIKLELPLMSGEYSPALTQAIQQMTQLTHLHLSGHLPALDYGALPHLRTLRLAGSLHEWPAGLQAIDGLELVDLSDVQISSLPSALFTGHERLWRHLRLNWRALEPAAFRQAFEYVRGNVDHLMDEPYRVAQYSERRLEELVAHDPAFAGNALAAFRRDGLAGQALLDKVEALHDDYRTWNASLVEWLRVEGRRVEGEQMPLRDRQALANRLRACWRDALAARYAPREPVAGPSRGRGEPVRETLDLSEYGALGDLPALGDTAFPQIRRVILREAKLTTMQVNDFLGRFPQVRELDLSGNRLTELPAVLESFGALTDLNLAGNELKITAPTQARLNRLSTLQRLDLSRNRVGHLDVTSMTNLVYLNLAQTQVATWPEGILGLPRLGFLDLSHSAITGIPEAALVGHDVLLAGTTLRGCRLSSSALATAQAFAERTGPGHPLASMFARPFGIDRAVLAAGRTGGDPAFFPVEASQQPDLLVPLPLEPGGDEAPLTSAARLQRLDPQLDLAQAGKRIDAWLAQGISATQIETALRQWQVQHTQMIERLNAWIDVPAVRHRNEWVNATDRRRASDRLLSCWRETLRDVRGDDSAADDYAIDLSGLVLGDLPALPVTFNHVRALDLGGVRLTTASEGFLRAFPRLNRLILNGNRLGTLPEAVTQMADLTQLGLNGNALAASEPLQRQLQALTRLQVLDLGANELETFDLAGLDHLQSLDLSHNQLLLWPVGALEAPALTSLDLRSNYPIADIPPTAFEPRHAALMAGTNLSGNLLREDELIRLREYQRETGRGLGFTAEEIDNDLAGYGTESDDDRPDVHPELEPAQVQKARWFEGVPLDSEKHAIWDTVIARDSTGDFANILAQLRNTRDFELDRADLAGRVWEVLSAAYGDEALSERLMAIARASRHSVTCGDGRSLLFNALEIEVYEFNALRAIDPTDKGRALLNLSRGLFRLGQLEEVARVRIRDNPRTDPAEIRLAYRLGLARRLALPRQPRSMLYASVSGVEPADLEAAYTTIMAREQTPLFIEQLAGRAYWVDYLQEQYPDAFAKLQQGLADKASALEDHYPDMNLEYLQRMEALQKAHATERQALISQLSAREIAALGS
ncbi:hypothetical protein HU723_20575 [Pseudomonas lurida]|uniref:dermonecrotic toxin domain-containing protein n=1 Tax=Pseudomonas lurida TaxID=244566 RepID=UPI00164657DB|nr:DUF6543 domain-containing protein [Pseudomonas lurida]MBC3241572.1 hypothetical protein [Pseudomonas lurida]